MQNGANYQAATLELPEITLELLGEHKDNQYPTVSPQWRRRWNCMSRFFAFPQETGKVIY